MSHGLYRIRWRGTRIPNPSPPFAVSVPIPNPQTAGGRGVSDVSRPSDQIKTQALRLEWRAGRLDGLGGWAGAPGDSGSAAPAGRAGGPSGAELVFGAAALEQRCQRDPTSTSQMRPN